MRQCYTYPVPDDLSDIVEYYNRALEQEHTRLDRHQLEYDLTWRYLSRYLPLQGSILEIGAATGRYTVELARRGYQVTAVDINAALLDRCKQVLDEAGLLEQVRLVVADARQLSGVPEEPFDAVLIMEPLYHLVLESDRCVALRQAYDRLTPGGIIFSAFISRYGILGDLLKNVPLWIEDKDEVQWLLAYGKDPADYPKGGFRGYFARVEEIAPLHETCGFETLAVVAVEPGISADDESYNNLQGEQRQAWLDLLYAVSQEPSCLGASRHLLYLGIKPT